MMVESCFIIFPNQLYEDFVYLSKLQKYKTIYIIEEPIYFYDPEYRPVKPNKIKIAYMRACMKYYANWLHSQIKKQNVIYIDYDQVVEQKYSFLQSYSSINYFETTDKDLDVKLEKHIKQPKVILPSPSFMMSIEQLRAYNSNHKTPKHASFYDFVKSELKILEGVKNQDKYNRKALPENISIPKQFPNDFSRGSTDVRQIYEEAIHYAKTKFTSHIGDAESLYLYPITHKDAYSSLEYFVNTKLQNFGPYQDAILQDEPFIFHSVLSPMLNIGLLDPSKVLHRVLIEKQRVSLNSLEGFIRQLVGWREYMRYIYLFKVTNYTPNLPKNKYFFKTPQPWYNGSTGVSIIDNEITKAIKYGYAHHIVRLMVFMNFFILCQLHPDQIYKWFMEVVSIDAYDWVMKSNIYSMGFFTKTGMHKPYISTSNYLLRMSNYKKDGNWDVLWTSLFYNFLKQKSEEAPGYVAFYKRLLKKASKHLPQYTIRSKSFTTKVVIV